MRWVVILAVIAVVLMFLGGWLYFRDSGETSELILDKQKAQQDTEAAVEESKEAVQEAAEGVQRLGDKMEDAFSEPDAVEEPAREENEPQTQRQP